MKWKKFLRIAAVTLIPGGLVALGAWQVVKKLRSSHKEVDKSQSDLAKHGQVHSEKEKR